MESGRNPWFKSVVKLQSLSINDNEKLTKPPPLAIGTHENLIELLWTVTSRLLWRTLGVLGKYLLFLYCWMLLTAFFFLIAIYLRNHIMATVTIMVQFCPQLWILETLESIKFTTPKNIVLFKRTTFENRKPLKNLLKTSFTLSNFKISLILSTSSK